MRAAFPVQRISKRVQRQQKKSKERKEVAKEEEIGAAGVDVEDAAGNRFARTIDK